jgi:hypothetical protein
MAKYQATEILKQNLVGKEEACNCHSKAKF